MPNVMKGDDDGKHKGSNADSKEKFTVETPYSPV